MVPVERFARRSIGADQSGATVDAEPQAYRSATHGVTNAKLARTRC